MFVSQYNWCWNCSICFLLYVLLSSHLQFFLLLKNLKCSLYSQKISKFLVVQVTRNFHLTQSTHKFLALVMHPGLFVNSQASSCFVAGTLLFVNLCIYACFSVFLQPSITYLLFSIRYLNTLLLVDCLQFTWFFPPFLDFSREAYCDSPCRSDRDYLLVFHG